MKDTFTRCIKKGAYLTIGLFFVISCDTRKPTTPTLEQYYSENVDSLVYQLQLLEKSNDLASIQAKYLKSRMYFKRLEPIMQFTEVENYETLNQPNLLQVEEEDQTNIRIQQPEGFQVIEEEIFSNEIDLEFLKSKINFIISRIQLMKKNNSVEKMKPHHILLAVRTSIISVATTGVTGFDSPAALHSLTDAKNVYQSLSTILSINESAFTDSSLFEEWKNEIDATLSDLDSEFESFDRFHFIINHTNKQFDLWNKTVKDWGVTIPIELALKNDATTLFSSNSFNINYFSGQDALESTKDLIELGKELFYDKNLSGTNQMSCGSCHQPELAFTDGQVKSIGLNEKALQRNAPTLKYVAYQSDFFYDKRAGNLEGQMVNVVNDENEFHSDLSKLSNYVNNNTKYMEQFQLTLELDSVSDYQIRQSIAVYIRSLAPFSSKFDRNIRGEEETFTQEELKGANLFMGTAGCATCHFLPFFNGTVPPRWKETELENLGVPVTAENKTLDTDQGRFNVYFTEERKSFFKTPTIRNISLTAPYMHNGVYDSLEQVIDFYNAGGGEGMGIHVPLQTLPPDSLHLSDADINALIAFMKTLNDEDDY